MSESEVLGEVSFKLSPRFSQLIGRNLISNPIIAVSELVKNAYDADSDTISIEFSDFNTGIPSLRITDDGEGMSYDDVITKWMMVGTDNKVQSPFTPKGRRKLGEKGIGRFSVERLAHNVEITSKKKGDSYAISFSVDWDAYEVAEGEFSQLKHIVKKIPANSGEKGTTIMLINLRDDWTADDLIDLKKELELLRPIDINDYSYKKYDFPGEKIKISLIAHTLPNQEQLINSDFISYAQAHLFGEIHEDNTSTIKVYIKPNISANRVEISEEFNYKEGEVDTSCGPMSFEVFVFLKDMRLYRSLEIDKKDMNDYLDAFCGVKIYRDGFRILPFGDTDNDWLELNAQRTSSPEHRLSTQNTIGIVYITRDKNPGLQDVLSRENMYDTSEFSALKSFVNLGFEKYTSLQLNARKKKERITQEEGKKALNSAQKAVTDFSREVASLKQSSDTLSQEPNGNVVEASGKLAVHVEKILDTAEKSLAELKSAYGYYKKQADFRSREMQIYRNIATLGISAAIFGHEALNQTVESKAIVNDILADYSKIIETADGLNNLLLDLQKDLILIDEKADFYRNYLRKERQDYSSYVNLSSSLQRMLSQHSSAFKAISVSPEVIVENEIKDLTTWAYEGDFDSVFTNLITNAYKALKKNNNSGYLTFTLKSEGDEIIISAENNGKPIDRENRNRIFEPMFSTYSDGTGLGLTIVQDTLQLYNGKIILDDTYPATRFIITIPRAYAPKEG